MAEISFYWDGTATGDATLAPYSPARYTTNWKNILTVEDNHGIINDHLDELLVSGIAGGVIVDTGAALVEGYFYENDAEVTVAIPTPVTDPRIDRIVIRKDIALQTARITRLAGTENPAPTAPAITQDAGGQWEIPIAQVLITVAGAITVTDERERTQTPLIPVAPPGQIEIETFTAVGTETTFDFQDIPQTFKHLKLEGLWSSTKPTGSEFAAVYLNGDTVGGGGNYWEQIYGELNSGIPNPTALAINQWFLINSRTSSDFPSSWQLFLPNYTGSFYKMIMGMQTRREAVAPLPNEIETRGTIWENTDAITRIQLSLFNGGVFLASSTATLYGLI